MKFTCGKKAFSSNLELINKIIPNRLDHPILGNILIAANFEEQCISLSGFNLRSGLELKFEAKIEEEGKILLPAKIINDIISCSFDGDISFKSEENEAKILTQYGKYEIPGIDPSEFPIIPEILPKNQVALPAEILAKALQASLFAASKDEMKQILCGLRVSVDNEKIEFIAIDGHRVALALIKRNKPSDSDKIEVTIPSKSIKELEDVLSKLKKDEEINIELSEEKVAFVSSTMRLFSRVIDGKYPYLGSMFPSKFKQKATLERNQLLSALERISVLALNAIEMTIDPKNEQITLFVQDRDFGTGSELISAQISGDELKIAFNVRYMIESVKHIKSKQIIIQIADTGMPIEPIIITPAEAEDSLQIKHLVMPIYARR